MPGYDEDGNRDPDGEYDEDGNWDPDNQPNDGRNNAPPGPTPRQSLLQPTGDADSDRAIIIRFFGDVFERGYDDAKDRWGWTDDDLDRIMEKQGLSPEQISNLRENKQFREGIQSGELPSPALRNALNNIESLRGRMNEVLDAGGRTDRTTFTADRAKDLVDTAGFGRMDDLYKVNKEARKIVSQGGQTNEIRELHELGTKLVKERGFTPEFRDAFDRLLTVVEQDPGAGTPGTTSAFSPAFNALQKIIKSGGSEGAGILPLEDVVGLVEAQAGQRSAEIAQQAQLESARRGLGPGAVTSGTDVAAESGQLQLNQETAAVGQALSSHQELRGQAVSSALQNLTRLAEAERNDPALGKQADVLGELIRATVTNIQTGASLGVGAQRLANERLSTGFGATAELSSIAAGREATGFQALLGAEGAEFSNRELATNTIAGGNEVQAGVGVDLQRQILDSLGQSGVTGQQGMNNYLQAIQIQRQPAAGYLGLAGQAVGGLGGPAGIQSGPPWWHGLLPGIPGAVGAAIPT